jgi:hypothetical protein
MRVTHDSVLHGGSRAALWALAGLSPLVGFSWRGASESSMRQANFDRRPNHLQRHPPPCRPRARGLVRGTRPISGRREPMRREEMPECCRAHPVSGLEGHGDGSREDTA